MVYITQFRRASGQFLSHAATHPLTAFGPEDSKPCSPIFKTSSGESIFIYQTLFTNNLQMGTTKTVLG